MKLNDREEPFTPICTTENVPLFVMYIKEELPEKHKSKLEAHLSQCADCKMNLAYIKEILQFKHHLSIDEKTLLLKYLSDPLFYYFANNIRKKVLEDIKEIVKEAKVQVSELNEVNNTVGIRVKDRSKAENLPKKLHQQIPYPYFVLTTSIILFLSLGISIVLALSSKYPTLQSYLPFSNSNTVVEETLPSNLGSELSINLAKTAENNRYQQLDTAIDEFLATKDRTHLEKAEIIAKDIQLFYEDNYGVDLVSYYQSVNHSEHLKLLECRQTLKHLLDSLSGDNYQVKLQKAEKLVKEFLLLNNTIESYKVKALLLKLYVLSFNDSAYQKLANECLSYSTKKKYLSLKLSFSLWRAKYYSNTANYSEVEEKFSNVIKLSKKLENQEVEASASMSLAGLYHINNKDKEALELAQKAMLLNNSRQDVIISLLHISGISAFKLNLPMLSESYFQQAIHLSQNNNNNFLEALSYTFLATTISETGHFAKAEEFFAKASNIANKVTDPTAKIDLFGRIDGYLAKSKLMQGDYQTATTLYQITLSRLKNLETQSNLELSQLNLGLSIALEKTGNKDFINYKQAGNHYSELAQVKNESQNCLLSFLPVQCN